MAPTEARRRGTSPTPPPTTRELALDGSRSESAQTYLGIICAKFQRIVKMCKVPIQQVAIAPQLYRYHNESSAPHDSNLRAIEADPRICNVSVERRIPCDRVALSTWEQRHSAILPEDLRNFYASSDGFRLTWHYKYSADQILPVGSIRVNSLNELFLSPALKDLLDFSLTRPNSGPRPVLNTKSKVFELDSCRTIGKVCLVFTGGAWSVWLATREGAWGWLADSFTHYFRMALVHLGLPGWQASFANLPLIPWAEQLFLLLAPHLLEKVDSENTPAASASDTGLNHIDPNIFKISVRQHKNVTRQTNA